MKTLDKTSEPTTATVRATTIAFAGYRTVNARLIGALFLSAFVFYGVGNGLVTATVAAPGFLATIPAHETTLVLGTLLMLLDSAAVIGIAALFFPILERHGKSAAPAYLAARTVEAVLLAVGVLCLLMLLPLAQHAIDTGEASAAWARTLGSLAIQANTMAYQIASMAAGLGGVFLCWLLFRTRLIPRFLAGWGVIGYAVFVAGAVSEILGIHIGLMLSIPGGLFEVALGVWLLLKGFQPETRGQDSDDRAAVLQVPQAIVR